MMILKKEKLFRYIFRILLVSCIIFIFSNSIRDAEASTAQSDKVEEIIQPVMNFEDPDYSVRKLAHFCEFTLEGFLFVLALEPKRRRLLIPVAGCFITACMDECIQLFSDGRAGLFSDVCIDTAGAAAGVCIGLCICAVRNRIRGSSKS